MAPSVIEPMTEVLLSGYIGQGPKVDQFEEKLANFIGNPYVCTVNSGTSALHLAIHMIADNATEERNEILTTPLTCTATNFPILAEKLKIKWVDLDQESCNVDLNDLRRKISPKTLAIMVVHWGGYPVHLNELKRIQDECFSLYGYRPPIIEDCAHAFGAVYNGKLLGNHGNICMFSFQAIKHLTTGDGGLLVLPDDQMYRRAKLLRWYGLDRTSSADFRCEQNIEEWGFKFHMNDIAATIGLANISHIPEILRKHRENANYLSASLLKTVTVMSRYHPCISSDWIFTIMVPERDKFMKKMKEYGIGCSRVHDRNDKHACLKEFKIPLPTTDIVCNQMCCIPCGWWLTQEDLDYIVDCIKKGW